MAIKGVPVTVVESGGIPVTPVEFGAPLLESIEEGGVAITFAANSTPFVVHGYAPNPPGPMSPLDYVSADLNSFTNFSRAYDLASTDAVLGLCCYYEGDPVISVSHGGEPLTIIHQERTAHLLSLIAAGTGLTIESADLTITATGGELHGGAVRINEMINVLPALSGWNDGVALVGRNASVPAVTGSQGGLSKIAVASTYNSASRFLDISGAETRWSGYITSGVPVDGDLSPTGPWVLGAGWSWVGSKLVHTGPESKARIEFAPSPKGSSGGGAVDAVVADGARCNASVYSFGVTKIGPFEGPITSPVSGQIHYLEFTATGDVELGRIYASHSGRAVGWAFGSNPCANGDIYGVNTTASGPEISISAAEILGEDYD